MILSRYLYHKLFIFRLVYRTYRVELIFAENIAYGIVLLIIIIILCHTLLLLTQNSTQRTGKYCRTVIKIKLCFTFNQ